MNLSFPRTSCASTISGSELYLAAPKKPPIVRPSGSPRINASLPFGIDARVGVTGLMSGCTRFAELDRLQSVSGAMALLQRMKVLGKVSDQTSSCRDLPLSHRFRDLPRKQREDLKLELDGFEPKFALPENPVQAYAIVMDYVISELVGVDIQNEIPLGYFPKTDEDGITETYEAGFSELRQMQRICDSCENELSATLLGLVAPRVELHDYLVYRLRRRAYQSTENSLGRVKPNLDAIVAHLDDLFVRASDYAVSLESDNEYRDEAAACAAIELELTEARLPGLRRMAAEEVSTAYWQEINRLELFAEQLELSGHQSQSYASFYRVFSKWFLKRVRSEPNLTKSHSQFHRSLITEMNALIDFLESRTDSDTAEHAPIQTHLPFSKTTLAELKNIRAKLGSLWDALVFRNNKQLRNWQSPNLGLESATNNFPNAK